MKKSLFETNTGHRFISKSEKAYRIHIHMPNDTILHRSVGSVKIGEKKALEKAIARRNELGEKHWGKFWKRVLRDETLLIRLPHTFEPILGTEGAGGKDEHGNYRRLIEVYRITWADKNGVRKCRKRSTAKHGRLGAYTQLKNILLKEHADVMDILRFMGRIKTTDSTQGKQNEN